MSLDRKLAVGIGALLLALGSLPILIGTGVVGVDPASVFAPPWLLVVMGLVFFLPGLMCVTGRLPWLIYVTFALFAVLPTWIAFGPGTREFGGGIALGPLVLQGHGMELAGRVFFGFWSVFLLGVLLRLLYDRARGETG